MMFVRPSTGPVGNSKGKEGSMKTALCCFYILCVLCIPKKSTLLQQRVQFIIKIIHDVNFNKGKKTKTNQRHYRK